MRSQAPRDSKAEKEWEQPFGAVLSIYQITAEASRSGAWPPRASEVSQFQRLHVTLRPCKKSLGLPVGVKLGTVIASHEGAEGASRVPRIYADLAWPGLAELNGWLLEAQTLHRRIGAWTGQLRRGWRSALASRRPSKNEENPWKMMENDRKWHKMRGKDLPTEWSLQHFQQYRAFRLPSVVGDSMASASSFMGRLVERSYHRIPRPAPRPAVIPATKLRVGAALGRFEALEGKRSCRCACKSTISIQN